MNDPASIFQGFLLGLTLGAVVLAGIATVFAIRALVKVEAFEKSTHQIQMVPMDPRDLAEGKTAPIERDIETGDEDLDEALADAEERELEGISAIHHRPGPLI